MFSMDYLQFNIVTGIFNVQLQSYTKTSWSCHGDWPDRYIVHSLAPLYKSLDDLGPVYWDGVFEFTNKEDVPFSSHLVMPTHPVFLNITKDRSPRVTLTVPQWYATDDSSDITERCVIVLRLQYSCHWKHFSDFLVGTAEDCISFIMVQIPSCFWQSWTVEYLWFPHKYYL